MRIDTVPLSIPYLRLIPSYPYPTFSPTTVCCRGCLWFLGKVLHGAHTRPPAGLLGRLHKAHAVQPESASEHRLGFPEGSAEAHHYCTGAHNTTQHTTNATLRWRSCSPLFSRVFLCSCFAFFYEGGGGIVCRGEKKTISSV